MQINNKLIKEIYSNVEQKIGIWIDGKPIYRKVIYISSLPNNETAITPHGIANIDEIVNIYGIMRTPSNHTTTSFNMAGTSAVYGSGNVLCIRADRTNVIIGTTANWSTNISYITLEYTKTTD